MRAPRDRGVAVDGARVREWIDMYGSYRVGISEGRIDRWLERFRAEHRDIAARALDCIEYKSQGQISAAFRDLLGSLQGWHLDEGRRSGEWRFVSFSVSAGESGDSMLHAFRTANGLGGKRFNRNFIHMSQLMSQNLTSDDSVVFVDDFAGTGDQACAAWEETLQELLPGGPKVYLLLVCAGEEARRKITEATDLVVKAHHELGKSDNIFAPECRHFTTPEKDTILSYCRRADAAYPKGYGGCGFMVVFAHKCPNNTIPIFHASNSRWEGLFRRND